MAKKQIKLRWSNKENDWVFNYPDDKGHDLAGVIFDMCRSTGHRTDWQEDLKNILNSKGYDFKTFKITCDKFYS